MTKSTQAVLTTRETQTTNSAKTTVLTTLDALTSEYRLVDMKYITTLTGMTSKWFYSLINENKFPKPIKLGRSSRWKVVDVHAWLDDRRKAVDGCSWLGQQG